MVRFSLQSLFHLWVSARTHRAPEAMQIENAESSDLVDQYLNLCHLLLGQHLDVIPFESLQQASFAVAI
jgi:hypothetical protein